MKLFLLFAASIFIPSFLLAGPRFPFPSSPDQVWQNDLDLNRSITTVAADVATVAASSSSVNCATVTCAGSVYNGANQLLQLDGSAKIPNSNIDTSSITKQGNTFNGASQLVKTDANSAISLSSGTITNLNTTNLTVTTETWRGFGLLPILQIQSYTTNISSRVTSSNFTNTLLLGSFTPKLITSKIIIFISGDFAQETGVSVGYATVARNGTNLASSTGGFTTTVAPNNYSASMVVYDSPATVSAITYSVQTRTNGGGTAVFPITDGGSNTSTANMVIVEIGQ